MEIFQDMEGQVLKCFDIHVEIQDMEKISYPGNFPGYGNYPGYGS